MFPPKSSVAIFISFVLVVSPALSAVMSPICSCGDAAVGTHVHGSGQPHSHDVDSLSHNHSDDPAAHRDDSDHESHQHGSDIESDNADFPASPDSGSRASSQNSCPEEETALFVATRNTTRAADQLSGACQSGTAFYYEDEEQRIVSFASKAPPPRLQLFLLEKALLI